MNIPKNVPQPVPIPDEEIEDMLEWTIEEEEEFLRILNTPDIKPVEE